MHSQDSGVLYFRCVTSLVLNSWPIQVYINYRYLAVWLDCLPSQRLQDKIIVAGTMSNQKKAAQGSVNGDDALNNVSCWGKYPIAGLQGDMEDAVATGIFGLQDFQIGEIDRHTVLGESDIVPQIISIKQRMAREPVPFSGQCLAFALGIVARNLTSEEANNCCVVPYNISVASGEAVKEMRRLKAKEVGASESTFLEYAGQVKEYATRNRFLVSKKIILFVDEGENGECQLVVVLNASYNKKDKGEGAVVCGFGVFCSKTSLGRNSILRKNSGLTFFLNVLEDGIKEGGSAANLSGRYGNVFAQTGRNQLMQLHYYDKEDLINPAACKSGNSWCVLLLVAVDFYLVQWRRDYRYIENQCEKNKSEPSVLCNAKYFKLGSLISVHGQDAQRLNMTREAFEMLVIKRVRGDFNRVLDQLTELSYTRKNEPFVSYDGFDDLLTKMREDNMTYDAATRALPRLLIDSLSSASFSKLGSGSQHWSLGRCFPSKTAADNRKRKQAKQVPVELAKQDETSSDTNTVGPLAVLPLTRETRAKNRKKAGAALVAVVTQDETTVTKHDATSSDTSSVGPVAVLPLTREMPSEKGKKGRTAPVVVGTQDETIVTTQDEMSSYVCPVGLVAVPPVIRKARAKDRKKACAVPTVPTAAGTEDDTRLTVESQALEEDKTVHDVKDDSEREFGDSDEEEEYPIEPAAVTEALAKWGTVLPVIPPYNAEYTTRLAQYQVERVNDDEYMAKFDLQGGLDLLDRLITTARNELEEQLHPELSTRERFRLETICERRIKVIEKDKSYVLDFIKKEYDSLFRATYLSLKYENRQWWALSGHRSADEKPIYTEHRVSKKWVEDNFEPGVVDAVKADAMNGDYFALPESSRIAETFEGRGQIVKLKFVPATTFKVENEAVTSGKRFRRSLLSTVNKREHFLVNNAEGDEWSLSIEEAKSHFDSVFLDAVVQRQSTRRRFVAILVGDAKERSISCFNDGPLILYRQGNQPLCLWASLSSALAYYPDLKEIAAHTFSVGASSDVGTNQWSLLLKLGYQHLSDRFQIVAIPSGAKVFPICERHHPHDIIVCALFDTSGSRGHAVAITGNFIFDGNERNALELSQSNLDRCVSTQLNKFTCINIAHGYVLSSPGRIVRSALNNLAKAFSFRGQREISELIQREAQMWPVAKCPSSLKAQGKHLNIINIIAGLFQKEPFKFRKITKNDDTIVRDPFDVNGDCKRRLEDILLMEVIDNQRRSVDAIVAVGSTWFGDSFTIGRSFCVEKLQSYLHENNLVDEYHGVVRCTLITTPRKNGNTHSLNFLNANYGDW